MNVLSKCFCRFNMLSGRLKATLTLTSEIDVKISSTHMNAQMITGNLLTNQGEDLRHQTKKLKNNAANKKQKDNSRNSKGKSSKE